LLIRKGILNSRTIQKKNYQWSVNATDGSYKDKLKNNDEI
jgi:hypothetical protein